MEEPKEIRHGKWDGKMNDDAFKKVYKGMMILIVFCISGMNVYFLGFVNHKT